MKTTARNDMLVNVSSTPSRRSLFIPNTAYTPQKNEKSTVRNFTKPKFGPHQVYEPKYMLITSSACATDVAIARFGITYDPILKKNVLKYRACKKSGGHFTLGFSTKCTLEDTQIIASAVLWENSGSAQGGHTHRQHERGRLEEHELAHQTLAYFVLDLGRAPAQHPAARLARLCD
jgi:hypothetical protein